MKTRRILIVASLAAALLLNSGCGDDTSKTGSRLPALENAGRVEIGGGRERLVCAWSDMPATLTTIRLCFSDGGPTLDVPVRAHDGSASLDNLAEGPCTVEVRYLTAEGTLYGGPTLSAAVYGDTYEAALKNRTLTGAYFAGATATLTLGNYCPDGLIGQEFSYTSAAGEEKTVSSGIELGGTAQTVAFDDVGSDLSYRCVYRPSELSGDLFRSPAATIVNYALKPSVEKNETVDGYRGIWFSIGQAASSYGPKYSGGLGTYTMKHIPMAVYAPAVDRTYFVYGGTPATGQKYLQCMVGCYDHKTDRLQKPRVVHDKGIDGVSDPHDDPTIQIDRDGYIWVFVAGRANKRPGIRYRSVNPYDITAFEYVSEGIMAYPQVHYHPEKGFFLFFTRYDGVRQLFFQSSADGITWTSHRKLASIKEGSETKSGHYQVSNILGTKVCTAFNRHINGNVDTRTNIYYVQSEDWGATWTTADGTPVTIPVTERYSNSLVADYQSQGRNCYVKDLNFDAAGNPVILCLTSDNHLTGPDGGTREWHILHWTGREWKQHVITTSTHCYDSGSLWIDGSTWTVIGPTDAGPQYWGAGGEVVVWRSTDQGVTWVRAQTLTANSTYNHTYVRRPLRAAEGFYAFWADGSPDTRTASHLYFCSASGTVRRMPYDMTDEWASPESL